MFIPAFIRFYQINYLEAELPLPEYKSLTHFFARRVRRDPPLNGINRDRNTVYSPADGQVAEVGRIDLDQAIQAKGMLYSVSALLAADASEFERGTYVTIYLSPADYHRLHVPITAHARRIVHIPGTLFPVNRKGTHYIDSLFTRNERVITWFRRHHSPVAMVKVGSTIVGSVQIDAGFDAKTPERRRKGEPAILWAGDRMMCSGDECAWFEFGSTVILLFTQGAVTLSVCKGDRVRACEVIGQWLLSVRDR